MNQQATADARSLLKNVIWESLHAIHEYTCDLTEEAFAQSRLVRDAIIRHLDLISRTAHKIPPDFRDRHADVAWERLDTLKHDLVISEASGLGHPPQAWRVIRQDLPAIQEQVRRAIEEDR